MKQAPNQTVTAQLLEALKACNDRMTELQSVTNYPLAWPRIMAREAIARAESVPDLESEAMAALHKLSTAAEGFDSLRDDDSRAEAYRDELASMSDAQEVARAVLAKGSK